MSSGGPPDFYSTARRSASASAILPATAAGGGGVYSSFLGLGQEQNLPFQGQDSGMQIRRQEFIGKRPTVDIQQNQQALGFYLRNVKKMRSHYEIPSLPFSPITSLPPEFSSPRFGIPIMRQQRPQDFTLLNANFTNSPVNGGFTSTEETEKSLMNHRLQELEKALLKDEDEDESASIVTNTELSEAIRNLIDPAQTSISPSPTSSSSSSSTSVSQPSLCQKQALIDAAVAMSEGKPDAAAEIFTRLLQEPKQRLTAYMVSAMKSRCCFNFPSIAAEEYAVSTQMLYCVSPCFKLAFMAANLAILEAASEENLCFEKIHVLDFELGQGGQYVHLLHTLAAAETGRKSLTITAFTYGGAGEEKLKTVGEGLKALSLKIGISLIFHVRDFNTATFSREELKINSDEALAVNFAFKLHKLPDESVTVENFRDDLLRRVKTLSPAVVTVVEQELNTNTAPLITRVRDAYDYYAALLESLDSTVAADCPDRARIYDGIGRRIFNSVAFEGRERVERCEVFGKWRSRMSMAGFQPFVINPRAADSLRSKLHSGTRVNPGFTVAEDSGGICFGWKGKTLTVASAWR